MRLVADVNGTKIRGTICCPEAGGVENSAQSFYPEGKAGRLTYLGCRSGSIGYRIFVVHFEAELSRFDA
jgi:hypothetical protein